MKNDDILKTDIENSIKWEPLLEGSRIDVDVQNGVVHLTGIVDSYLKKIEAESTCKIVIGVKHLISNLEIQCRGEAIKTDEILKDEIYNLLVLNWNYSTRDFRISVKNGLVRLEGFLEWNYQKISLQNMISPITGIKGITNLIKIKSKKSYSLIKEEIEEALVRNWTVGKEDIEVMISGHKVRLIGRVQSLLQKEEAARIAWKAPGVTAVDNYLFIYS